MRLTLLACLSLLCVAVAGAIMQERDQIVCVVKLLRSPASNKAEEMLLAELEKWIRMVNAPFFFLGESCVYVRETEGCVAD